MSVNINFRITDAGQSAVFSATGTGTSLNLTHVQVGSGNRTPTASETALVAPIAVVPIGYGIKISPTQIRMMATFTGSTTFDIYEVGIWSGAPGTAGAVLVCYYSHPTDKLTSKFADVDFVFLHDMVISGILPDDSINITYDNNAALMVAAVTDHISGVDPHPQYLTQAEADARYPQKKHLHVSEDIIGSESQGRPLRTQLYKEPGDWVHTILPEATYMEVHAVGSGGIAGTMPGGGGGYTWTGIIDASSFTFYIGKLSIIGMQALCDHLIRSCQWGSYYTSPENDAIIGSTLPPNALQIVTSIGNLQNAGYFTNDSLRAIAESARDKALEISGPTHDLCDTLIPLLQNARDQMPISGFNQSLMIPINAHFNSIKTKYTEMKTILTNQVLPALPSHAQAYLTLAFRNIDYMIGIYDQLIGNPLKALTDFSIAGNVPASAGDTYTDLSSRSAIRALAANGSTGAMQGFAFQSTIYGTSKVIPGLNGSGTVGGTLVQGTSGAAQVERITSIPNLIMPGVGAAIGGDPTPGFIMVIEY